ncbi:hypothetical protein QF039_006670 [Pseudomonas sp. W2I6]|jgi:hypothetical protein|nr:hypothetical protein [Pseudomonas sp. W2I6]
MEKSVASTNNELTVDAEAVTAFQALIVIQHLLINLFTQCGPSDPAGSTTKQPSEYGASDTTHSNPNRPADYAEYCTGFRSRQGSGGPTDCTSCSANQPTRLLTDIFLCDTSRIAARARGIHT